MAQEDQYNGNDTAAYQFNLLSKLSSTMAQVEQQVSHTASLQAAAKKRPVELNEMPLGTELPDARITKFSSSVFDMLDSLVAAPSGGSTAAKIQ